MKFCPETARGNRHGIRREISGEIFWEFGEGVDSARGVAAIVVCCRNSSCNSSCDAIARNG